MPIAPDRLERVILASVTSTSGKYRLILGEHISHGRFCYDVLALNQLTSEVLCRHYGDGVSSDEANKATALAYFDEMREKLTAPAKDQEKDERQPMQVLTPEGKPYVM